MVEESGKVSSKEKARMYLISCIDLEIMFLQVYSNLGKEFLMSQDKRCIFSSLI